MITLNTKQKYAVSRMNIGSNVFLTGGAGVGKSEVIKDFMVKSDSQIIVCAPTGVAALNVNGATCHRVFNIPLKPLVNNPTSIPALLKDVDTVIIDEISMLRIDTFDYIAIIILNINKHREKSHQKPLQVIVVGDFFQLPPVLTDNDREILEQLKYGNRLGRGFAFQSQYWNLFNFEVINLTEIVRQDNKEFAYYLNQARVGNRGSISYFNSNSNRYEIKDAVLLCGTNRKVDDKNNIELGKLKSKEYTFLSKITGTVSESDKLVPDELKLKVGCRVMTVVNDYADELYSNGTLATVKAIDKDCITIETDDGYEANILKYTWDIKNYKGSKDKNGKVSVTSDTIGTFTQFPLRLGYAITIHKSQGKTFDKVNLDPYCWDCGQLYVAMSRVRTIQGLHLTQYIGTRFLVTSADAQLYYSKIS